MQGLLAKETPLGNITGLGPLADISNSPSLFASVLSGAIGLMTIVAAIWFLFNLITGAISIISAGGDKAAMEEARRKITVGFIGIVVVIAAIFIMDLVATFLGVPNILNVTAMLDLVSPK